MINGNLPIDITYNMLTVHASSIKDIYIREEKDHNGNMFVKIGTTNSGLKHFWHGVVSLFNPFVKYKSGVEAWSEIKNLRAGIDIRQVPPDSAMTDKTHFVSMISLKIPKEGFIVGDDPEALNKFKQNSLPQGPPKIFDNEIKIAHQAIPEGPVSAPVSPIVITSSPENKPLAEKGSEVKPEVKIEEVVENKLNLEQQVQTRDYGNITKAADYFAAQANNPLAEDPTVEGLIKHLNLDVNEDRDFNRLVASLIAAEKKGYRLKDEEVSNVLNAEHQYALYSSIIEARAIQGGDALKNCLGLLEFNKLLDVISSRELKLEGLKNVAEYRKDLKPEDIQYFIQTTKLDVKDPELIDIMESCGYKLALIPDQAPGGSPVQVFIPSSDTDEDYDLNRKRFDSSRTSVFA